MSQPRTTTTTSGPTYAGNAASASIDLSAIGGGGFEAGKTFSAPVIGALVVATFIGAAFMWAIMSSWNANQLLEIQQNDAIKLRDAARPKIAAFTELAEKIAKMPTVSPDFDAADALTTADFAISGAVLSNVTIPLPGTTTDSVSTYAADSAQLKQMLADHKRYTNGVDRDELTKLMEDNKAVEENAGFGIVINPQAIADKWDKDDYRPQMGTLVGFKKVIEESKKVEIAILPAGDIRQVPLNEFIPIDKAQILKAGGQNAMQRYAYRVKNIKFQANKISQYTESLLTSLDIAAGNAPAAAAAPVEEAAEEPAAAPPTEEAAEEEEPPAE